MRTEQGARELRKILVHAAHKLGQGDMAEDLAQYALIKQLEAKHPEKVKFNRYAVIDAIRQYKGNPRTAQGRAESYALKTMASLFDEKGQLQVQPRVEAPEFSSEFENMIHTLDEETKQLFRLRFIEGYTSLEISRLLGKSKHTINQIFYRTLIRFRVKYRALAPRGSKNKPKRRFLVKGIQAKGMRDS